MKVIKSIRFGVMQTLWYTVVDQTDSESIEVVNGVIRLLSIRQIRHASIHNLCDSMRSGSII